MVDWRQKPEENEIEIHVDEDAVDSSLNLVHRKESFSHFVFDVDSKELFLVPVVGFCSS